MATVSFASAHTPLMQPPPALLAADAAVTNGFDCNNENEQRVLMNQMVEALDTEVGRLLVGIGVAQRGADGSLVYPATQTDTMVVILGDNGLAGRRGQGPVRYQPGQGHRLPDRCVGCRSWSPARSSRSPTVPSPRW